MNVDALRSRYLPKQVKLLFVGESPPQGGTFFYACNSHLFRYTKASFERTLERSFNSDHAFLEYFTEQAFFLDDLCLQPVNGMKRSDRRRCCREGVAPLSKRIGHYKPQTLLITPMSIEADVRQSLSQSGHRAAVIVLPFPANGWQLVYQEKLSEFLRERKRDS